MNLQDIDLNLIQELEKSFTRGVIFLDLETTGLSPLVDRMIEISGVKYKDGEWTTFDQLVNPEIPIPEHTTDIHGITDEDVAGAAPIRVVLPEFLEFMEDCAIVAHNAKFDSGFLLFWLHQLGLPFPNSRIYCSWRFSKMAFPELQSYKLGNICESLDLVLENHHRALDDAYACLQIFLKGLQSLYKKEAIRDGYLYHMKEFEKYDHFEIPEHLKGLVSKVCYQQIVDIKYTGGNHKNKYRPIRPVSFLPMPEGLVLYGLCLLSNMQKSFFIRKIQAFKELNGEEIKKRLELIENFEN